MISQKIVWKAIFLVEYAAHISGVRTVEASVRRDFLFCYVGEKVKIFSIKDLIFTLLLSNQVCTTK